MNLPIPCGYRLARVLGLTGQSQGLGATESDRVADLACASSERTLDHLLTINKIYYLCFRLEKKISTDLSLDLLGLDDSNSLSLGCSLLQLGGRHILADLLDDLAFLVLDEDHLLCDLLRGSRLLDGLLHGWLLSSSNDGLLGSTDSCGLLGSSGGGRLLGDSWLLGGRGGGRLLGWGSLLVATAGSGLLGWGSLLGSSWLSSSRFSGGWLSSSWLGSSSWGSGGRSRRLLLLLVGWLGS